MTLSAACRGFPQHGAEFLFFFTQRGAREDYNIIFRISLLFCFFCPCPVLVMTRTSLGRARLSCIPCRLRKSKCNEQTVSIHKDYREAMSLLCLNTRFSTSSHAPLVTFGVQLTSAAFRKPPLLQVPNKIFLLVNLFLTFTRNVASPLPMKGTRLDLLQRSRSFGMVSPAWKTRSKSNHYRHPIHGLAVH